MKLYDWNQVEKEQLNPRVRRQVIHTQNMTIARLELQKSAVVPEHHHVNEQVTTMQSGSLKFIMDGGEHIVRAGESLVIPPDVPHSVEALEDSVAVDTFCPRRDDWLNGDDSYLRR